MLKNKKNLTKIISISVLLFSFLFLIIFLYKKIECMLDSDMSSELLLSKILSNEKKFLTKNWFYSTELRVLNTQIIYSLIFLFSKNWLVVRLVSLVIMLVLLLASFYYMSKNIKCNKYFPFFSIFLIVPFSAPYFNFVLKGAYYIPHIIISFLIIGMIYYYINCDSNIKKKMLLLIYFALSFVSGLGGPRQLIILYFPLILSSLLWILMKINKKNNIKNIKDQKYFSFIPLSFLGTLFAFLGYLLNSKVLTSIYNFQSWDTIKYTYFNINNFLNVINGFFESFGFVEGNIFSFATVSNVICIIIIIISIICSINSIKNKKVSDINKQITLFYICAIIIYIFLYSFTDLVYNVRYNLPIIVFAFPVIMINIKEGNFEDKFKKEACMLLTLCILLNSMIQYGSLIKIDKTYQLRQIVANLQEQNYNNGYASFWNSNVLTELSNGSIEMYTWYDSCNDGSCFSEVSSYDELYDWLQVTSHKYNKPNGKIFLLLKNNELEHCVWKNKLKDENIILSVGDYVVYGYDDYDSMRMELK